MADSATELNRDEINDAFNRIADETPDPNAKGETPRYSPDDERN
jgi:hypothetical protein